MKTNRPLPWIGAVLLGVLVLIVLLPGVRYLTPISGVLACLSLGWSHFLGRNLQQITLNWDLIGTGAICSVFAIVLGNWLLGVMLHTIQEPSHAGQLPHPWRWRWTISIYCGIWLLFAIAFGSAGVLRHTTWLLKDPRPWYQQQMGSSIELRMVDVTLQQLLIDHGQDLETTRKALLGEASYRHQNLIIDEFNVIFYGDKSNKVAAYLIIPRNPQLDAHGEFVLLRNGTSGLRRPISELRQTLAELDSAFQRKGPR